MVENKWKQEFFRYAGISAVTIVKPMADAEFSTISFSISGNPAGDDIQSNEDMHVNVTITPKKDKEGWWEVDAWINYGSPWTDSFTEVMRPKDVRSDSPIWMYIENVVVESRHERTVFLRSSCGSFEVVFSNYCERENAEFRYRQSTKICW
tara:strand:+ start:376 stop:828 length:453 start_codon:yes stop_codon:yes gene_type:complete